MTSRTTCHDVPQRALAASNVASDVAASDGQFALAVVTQSGGYLASNEPGASVNEACKVRSSLT